MVEYKGCAYAAALAAVCMVAGGCAHDMGTTRASADQCKNFAAGKRAESFASDVVAVQPIRRRQGKQMTYRTLGADVLVTARRGDSAPWLRQLVMCRLSDGWLSEFSGDGDVDVKVFGVGSEFVVRVTSPVANQGRALAQKTQERWAPKSAGL